MREVTNDRVYVCVCTSETIKEMADKGSGRDGPEVVVSRHKALHAGCVYI